MSNKWPSFSLLFFASRQADYETGKFDLFRSTTAFADQHDFEAVWVPERHFHAFGGIFPNPSLAAVVLAENTERIRIRAGSVVLPLHSPIRVAEEWAVVDNLSEGRVDLSFAIGWNPNDFCIAPENFADRKRLTYEGIETVRKLWRGDAIEVPNGLGEPVELQVHPLPLQDDLAVWFTCSGGPERFVEAGQNGFNILTALLFQSVDELQTKVAAYRQAWQDAGHPGHGQVTLMLHTYIGPDEQSVRDKVREPFKEYLASSVDLWKGQDVELQEMSDRKRDDLLEFAFERYYRRTGLLGTPESCSDMVAAIRDAGVDEIACLIDFGIAQAEVLGGLEYLDQLRRSGL